MKIVIAADHAGFALKEILKAFLASLGHEVEDCGAFSFDENDDYPDFIQAAAGKVSKGTAERGIVIGASGQGEAIAANRFKNVRCALFYGNPAHDQIDAGGKSLDMIASVREHNDANMLSLAGRFLTEDVAKEAVKRWLELPFSNAERHVRRIKKIDA